MNALNYMIIGVKSWIGKIITGFVFSVVLGISSLARTSGGVIDGLVALVMVFVALYIKGFVLNKLWGWDKKTNIIIIGVKSLIGDVVTMLIAGLLFGLMMVISGIGLVATEYLLVFLIFAVIVLLLVIPIILAIEGKVVNFFWKWE